MTAMEEETVEMISEWPVTGSEDGAVSDNALSGAPRKRKSASEARSKDILAKTVRPLGSEKVISREPGAWEGISTGSPGAYMKNTSPSCCDENVFQVTKANHSQDSSVVAKDGPVELLAQARLARWWRREGQHEVGLESHGETLPDSTNPNTLLYHVARTAAGKRFLQKQRQHLKQQVEHMGREATADVVAALGSVEEWLGHIEDAVHHVQKATEMDPDNKQWRWLLHKLSRQLCIQRRQLQLLPTVSPSPIFPASKQVKRVSAKNLTFLEFFHKFAMARVPVIITDLASTMSSVTWDLQHVGSVAGDCMAQVKRSVSGSVEWAQLEESRTVKVSDFLHHLHSGSEYLFDWSLPLHCPRLAEELTIPKYFASDFLQRTNPGSLYQDSWPSLFVAPPGVHSELHVDAFASNFWMALFQGRKRWVFFHQEDTPCLYPVYANSLDPTFEAKVNDPDLKTHPLLSLVQPLECVLCPGEVLFVPGGCPHCVENLDTTLAISANFVDLSNWRRVLHELDINGLQDPRAADLAAQFRQPGFVSRMKSDMGDLPWRQFKAWPPNDADSFDITEDRDSVASK